MILFITGFICANSGWSPVLAIWLSDRPDWSVCNQDLCLCIKPIEAEPYCPLCLTDTPDPNCTFTGTDSDQSQTPGRVPNNPHSDAITFAGELGCASVFIAFVFGNPLSDRNLIDNHAIDFVDPDDRVALNQPDIPSPPPKS